MLPSPEPDVQAKLEVQTSGQWPRLQVNAQRSSYAIIPAIGTKVAVISLTCGGGTTKSPCVSQVHEEMGQYPYWQDQLHRSVKSPSPLPPVHAGALNGDTMGMYRVVGESTQTVLFLKPQKPYWLVHLAPDQKFITG